MANTSNNRNWASHQKRWYGKWHLWVGLVAGSVIFIVSITGTALVYENEINMWLYPSKYEFDKEGELLSYQQIHDSVTSKHPDWQIRSIFAGHDEGEPHYVYRKGTRSAAYIDPYTGNILGESSKNMTLMRFILKIHRTLLIPKVGRYIVAASALALVVLLISGLRLWIPRHWSQIKSSLIIKRKANATRVNLDIHKTLGLYFSPFLLLISITGIVITFSFLVVPVIYLLSFQQPKSLEELSTPKSIYIADNPSITIADVERIAREELPMARIDGVRLPADSVGAFVVNANSPHVTHTGDHDFLYIDQYTGDVRFNTQNDLPNIAKLYLNWVTPIHYGTFGGAITRVVAFVATLIPPILFITGIIIWINRRRKLKQSNSQKYGDGIKGLKPRKLKIKVKENQLIGSE